jgi:hypothetical protein
LGVYLTDLPGIVRSARRDRPFSFEKVSIQLFFQLLQQITAGNLPGQELALVNNSPVEV